MKVSRSILITCVFAFLVIIWGSQAGAMPSIYPTGTTIYKPELCSSGYVLVNLTMELPKNNKCLLIDRNGRVVHSWSMANTTNPRVRLLPNGNLFLAGVWTNDAGRAVDSGVKEFDWDGNLVWQVRTPKGGWYHNEARRLENGNTMFPYYETIPKEVLAGIKDSETPWWGLQKRKGLKIESDCLVEVNPKGEVVWEWRSYEHLDINRYSPVNLLTDWTHVNTVMTLPENKWYDGGDLRFKPGNILFNPRNLDEVFIIDKETKKIVWSWTTDYKGGLSHCHETEMIEKGLPGEGNILVFDNGLFPRHRDHVGQSYIIEINPVSKEMVWKYETVGYSNIRFFSKTMGSQKRLPNGNTFISEDNTGRIFEVKHRGDHPDGGEIVWEYVAPAQVARCQPIPYDFCPQLKAMPKPKEVPVVPPKIEDFHINPTQQ